MTTTAQSIIKAVQEQLQDMAGVRWTAPELIDALNDGQRQLVNFRPDLHSIQAVHALVVGAKQTIPANCSQLLEIPRNTSGASIRMVERRLLDAMEPNWYNKAGVLAIKHACVAKEEPHAFYVYPPAALGASVDLVYAPIPVDVSAPAGTSYTTVTGNIGIDDTLQTSLMHYCLYWAFAKDAEYGGNLNLSAMHYKLFKSGAGINVPADPPTA